jgi:hypothetical protein
VTDNVVSITTSYIHRHSILSSSIKPTAFIFGFSGGREPLGKLFYNASGQFDFEGDATESAKQFFNEVITLSSQKQAALEAELERLRQDAARYQWLKNKHFKVWSRDMSGNHVWSGIGRPIGTGPTLDAVIDKALAGGGGE